MATILTLAPELIHRIADHMKGQDAKSMRLTCRQLGGFLESKILHTITLQLNRRNLVHIPEGCQPLAMPKVSEAISRSARRLVIGYLSPIHDPNFWGPISENDNGTWAASTKTNYGPNNCDLINEAKKYLMDAFTSLQNIHSVIWRTEYDDTEWAQTTVISGLTAMPHLQRLDVMLAYARIPLPLHNMRNLREITLSEGNTPSNALPNSQTFANLAALIAQSPPGLITHLQASHGYYDTVRTDDKPNLHELLDSHPGHKTPLRLRHLGITNAFVRLDEKTTPHLRFLTSLDISNVLQPRGHIKRRRGRYRAMELPIDPAVHQKQRAVGSSVEEIWKQLSQLEVFLEQITLSDVTPAFLKYLEGYSGLKHLSIRVRGFDTEAESNALAQPFFEYALARHTGSLQRLKIEAPYEGLWCFGDVNHSVLSACTRLRHLALSLMIDNFKDSTSSTMKRVEDAIDTLIDMTSANMPELVDVRLNIANLEKNRRSFCGTGALLYYSTGTKRITDHIYRFCVSVRTHPCIPVLYLGPKTFEPGRLHVLVDTDTHSGGEWKWMYRLVS